MTRGAPVLTTYAGGHLGQLVAPLVDGQLRPSTSERAWAHVLRCQLCTDSVRRQTWVKNQLLLTQAASPPDSLAARLCALPDSLGGEPPAEHAGPAGQIWPGSPRTRVVAAAGVGGLSAAAFVVASLVGLPAVGGPIPVEASLTQPTATSGGPGASLFKTVLLERPTEGTRRIGLP